MGKLEDAVATQLANIEGRVGRPVAEIIAAIRAEGLEKHGAMVSWLKAEWGLGHGDANLLAHQARAATAPAGDQDPAEGWYAGAKAAQRPIHDAVVEFVDSLGDDIEHSPMKSYLSLRRRRQFATVGPAARSTVEIGVNLPGAPGDECMEALGAGKMCTHRRRIGTVEAFDDAVQGWLKRAFEAAG